MSSSRGRGTGSGRGSGRGSGSGRGNTTNSRSNTTNWRAASAASGPDSRTKLPFSNYTRPSNNSNWRSKKKTNLAAYGNNSRKKMQLTYNEIELYRSRKPISANSLTDADKSTFGDYIVFYNDIIKLLFLGLKIKSEKLKPQDATPLNEFLQGIDNEHSLLDKIKKIVYYNAGKVPEPIFFIYLKTINPPINENINKYLIELYNKFKLYYKKNKKELKTYYTGEPRYRAKVDLFMKILNEYCYLESNGSEYDNTTIALLTSLYNEIICNYMLDSDANKLALNIQSPKATDSIIYIKRKNILLSVDVKSNSDRKKQQFVVYKYQPIRNTITYTLDIPPINLHTNIYKEYNVLHGLYNYENDEPTLTKNNIYEYICDELHKIGVNSTYLHLISKNVDLDKSIQDKYNPAKLNI